MTDWQFWLAMVFMALVWIGSLYCFYSLGWMSGYQKRLVDEVKEDNALAAWRADQDAKR